VKREIAGGKTEGGHLKKPASLLCWSTNFVEEKGLLIGKRGKYESYRGGGGGKLVGCEVVVIIGPSPNGGPETGGGRGGGGSMIGGGGGLWLAVAAGGAPLAPFEGRSRNPQR